LVDHARRLTPPAELAYKRAAEMAPGHPAAPFFYGLALARSGDRQNAVAMWQQILKTAPADAEWRPLVEQGVAALSRPPSATPR
jgi:cytochrome c-type biogenesis protein CcmH